MALEMPFTLPSWQDPRKLEVMVVPAQTALELPLSWQALRHFEVLVVPVQMALELPPSWPAPRHLEFLVVPAQMALELLWKPRHQFQAS
mmetsp:Transcript_93021/g.299417  ORF Transcript_93021/g.299417 Transcript_93021/m.299417 type:complete len:89 (-) Transcript_93021:804-1070(-)